MLNSQDFENQEIGCQVSSADRTPRTETSEYVMDLLNDLVGIAKVVGLDELSSDIGNVIMKHCVRA